jgi:hypothetical protein
MRIPAAVCVACVALGAIAVIPGTAQQQFPPSSLVTVRAIEPPDTRLPAEAATSGQTRFSFIAYGDTRSQVDGRALQPEHGAVIASMVATIASRASTRFPVRFVLQSGDAVSNGTDGAAWNISFAPLVEKITRGAGIPYFLTAGNHDVSFGGDASRPLGLHNTLSALAKLIPPEGSPRRLAGYPTYAFGYGNLFAIAIDSNIAADPLQLAWVTDQLVQLDRARYRHVIAFFHHPLFSSGPHGGVSPGGVSPGPNVRVTADSVEPQTAALRMLYAPVFRYFHVRMTISGHDHLLDHWVERYTDAGMTYRRDDVVTGGGGAPIYAYLGEPQVQQYVASGVTQTVRLSHLMRPGPTAAENPHHFVVIQVDGDRLSVEVIGTGPTVYKPYDGQSRMDLNDPR